MVQRIQRGSQSLEDDPRSHRPSDAVNPISIAAVKKLIWKSKSKSVRDCKRVTNFSWERENITHEHLHISKLFSHWVAQNLNVHDRHRRVASCQQFLALCTSDKEKFCRRLVTGDETWIHCWNPEYKLESMQWKHMDSAPP